ncbi:MAG: zinc ribbon domain-containing protein [Pyrinomonadaceae bacterium]
MHCPKCGQQQISEDTRFCSRCGFLLVGVSEVVSNGGLLPHAKPARTRFAHTPRNTGLKQGLFIFLLSFLLVPLAIIISIGLRAGPVPAVMLTILLAVGGMLGWLTQCFLNPTISSAASSWKGLGMPSPQVSSAGSQNRMNSGPYLHRHTFRPEPARGATPTNEPGSITDKTTKLLKKEEQL